VEERKKEGLGILESWIGVTISMNSVLDGLREKVRRHPVGNVREERTQIVGFRCRFKGFRRRQRYVELSVISIEVVVIGVRGNELMSELRGLVKRLKRMGPRTESWGMPEVRGKDEDERPDAVTMKEREVR
jgi:hypothetical protein